MTKPDPLPATINADLARLGARRYAEAVAAAAAAQAQIDGLVEQLVEHEYVRQQAEMAADGVRYDPQIGTVYPATGVAPPTEVHALLCLITGVVYIRPEGRSASNADGGWRRAGADPHTSTTYDWPIDSSGPFIGWREAYGFDRVLAEAERGAALDTSLRRVLYGKPGYADPDNPTSYLPPLAPAVQRVVRTLESSADEAKSAAHRQHDAAVRLLSIAEGLLEVVRATTSYADFSKAYAASHDDDNVDTVLLNRVMATFGGNDSWNLTPGALPVVPDL